MPSPWRFSPLISALPVPPSAGEGVCEITWGEMFAVLPFGNRTVIAAYTGAQLTQALLNGFSPACNPQVATGRFPQVAGAEAAVPLRGHDAGPGRHLEGAGRAHRCADPSRAYRHHPTGDQ
jgi:5'-nucleotidase-like protein